MNSLNLTCKRADQTVYNLGLSLKKKERNDNKKENIIQLEENYYLINLDVITYKDFIKNIEKLKSAKGLIFDLRNRPHWGVEKILRHLYDKNMTSATWNIPIIYYPNFKNVIYQTSKWQINSSINQINTNIIFLINRSTISYGESIAEIVKYYKIGTLLGENTAGTNGDMNFAIIGDTYQMAWTGTKVKQRDEGVFHGIGVTPQIKVKPTMESIKNQKDNLVFEAIKYLKQ